MVVTEWADERTRIIVAQAAASERAAAKEAAQAKLLIDAFVAEALRRGIKPHPLLAPGPDLRRRRFRTSVVGWYLSRDERVAVDPQGRYFVLRAQGTMLERLFGAAVEPMDPPLVVGRGARDGEAIDLQRLLDRRLENSD